MKRYNELEDFESDFDYGTDDEKRKRKKLKDDELFKKPRLGRGVAGTSKAKDIFDEEHSLMERQKRRLMTMDVYSRHKELINQYYLYYPGSTSKMVRDTSKDLTDYDFLRKNHRFLWNEEELNRAAEKSWEFRLAKRYYDKLFKEYCIADLTQYRKNRIAMRWRTEQEVRSGKGQFECGDKRCSCRNDLTSWEVNFAYIENAERKNALVKLRLCPQCSTKLNFHSKRRRFEKKRKNIHKPIKKEVQTVSSQNIPTIEESEILKAEKNEPSQLDTETEKLKEESRKMMEIWIRPQEEVDCEKAVDDDLDEFLDDMFI